MKKVWVTALVLILLGFAAWVLLSGNKPLPGPTSIALPNGATIRIVGATYGTNHMIGTRLQRIAASLPVKLQDFMNDYLNIHLHQAVMKMTTPKPQLVVWIEEQTNTTSSAATTSSYVSAILGDANHFTSGSDIGVASYPGMTMTYPLTFEAFPRREKILTLNIFEHSSKDGSASNCCSLSFTNPVYQTYPQWQPESLPATKRVGDLEITLQDLETGHDQNQSTVRSKTGRFLTTYGTARKDGRNGTAVYLNFRPLENTNEIWQAVSVDVSDATGNSLPSYGMSWNGNDASFVFTPGLWPDEAAWKIKLGVKRTAGFLPIEIITFKNVPLGLLNQTNSIVWITNVNGGSITLQSIHRQPSKTNETWVTSKESDLHVTLSDLVAGYQCDLLRMVYDTGNKNTPDGWSSSGSERNYYFGNIPEAAKTADLIFALQKVRTVEFTVKPKLPERGSTNNTR